MAYLWIHETDGWGLRCLAGGMMHLAQLAPAQADSSPSSEIASSQSAAVLFRVGCDGSEAWVIIAGPLAGVRVNGDAPQAGLRVLSDRDEIRTSDGRRYFFSGENLAEVQAFPGAERPVFCGRCRRQIADGAGAVRCPGCGVWYDQCAELPCWTYTDRCAFCGCATALDAGFVWTPEDGLV